MAKKIVKISALILGALAAIILLALVAIASILGSESGRLWLSQKGLDAVNGPALSLQIKELQSPELGLWRFSYLKVNMQGKPIAELQNVELNWSPKALLARELRVRHVKAERVSYLNSPPASSSEANEAPDKQSEGSFNFMPVYIDELAIQKIQLPALNSKPDQAPLPEFKLNTQAALFLKQAFLQLELEAQTLDEKNTQLQISGSSPKPSLIQLKGRLLEKQHAWLADLLKLPDQQNLDAQFDLELEAIEQQIIVSINQFNVPLFKHQFAAQGTLDLNPSAEHFQIKELLLTTDDRTHKIAAAYSKDNLWFDLSLNKLPLTLAKPWVEDLQSGELSGQFQGDWLHSKADTLPNVKAEADFRLKMHQQALSGTTRFNLKNKLLQIDQANINLGQGQLTASGQLDLLGANNKVQAQLKNFDSTWLKPWLDAYQIELPVEAQVKVQQLKGSLTGSLEKPKYSISARASGVYDKQDLELDTQLKGDLQKVDFEQLQLSVLGSQIYAQGILDWTNNGNKLELEAKNLSDQLFVFVPAEYKASIPEGINFKGDIEALIKGQLTGPDIKARADFAGRYNVPEGSLPYQFKLDVNAQLADTNNLIFDVRKMQVDVFDKPAFMLSGHYSNDAFDVSLIMQRLPTQTLALFGFDQIKGEAHADLRLSGNMEAPVLNGDFNYSNVLVDNEGQAQNIEWQGQLDTIENALDLEVLLLRAEDELGSIQLNIPLKSYLAAAQGKTTVEQLQLEGQVKTNLDLKYLNLFFDPELHEMGGNLLADFSVSGSPTLPNINGELKLQNAYYRYEVYGTDIHEINLDIQSKGQHISIAQANARTPGSGKISAEGDINWSTDLLNEANTIGLKITAKDARLIQRQDMQGSIGGKVNVDGNMKELKVEGKLDLMPLNISIDSTLKTSIPEITVTEVKETKASSAEDSIAPIINLAIDINVDQQAYIRGRGLETEVAGNIKLRGTASSPEYTGQFSTRRGKLDALGKTFILQDGLVRISNDVIGLNIPAIYQDDDHEFVVEVYGTSDAPKFKVSSTPALPDDEILSRLIFGKSVQEITPFQAVRLAAAVRTLSSGGGFDPIDSARNALGVDTLSLDSKTNDNDEQFVSVGIGKYINDRVYVEVERSNNPAQPWEGSIQVELTPKVNLKGGTGETGAGEAEILWKKDY